MINYVTLLLEISDLYVYINIIMLDVLVYLMYYIDHNVCIYIQCNVLLYYLDRKKAELLNL